MKGRPRPGGGGGRRRSVYSGGDQQQRPSLLSLERVPTAAPRVAQPPAQHLLQPQLLQPRLVDLRRIKNVVMVMEWAPAADDPASLRLFTGAEHEAMAMPLDAAKQQALHKAFCCWAPARRPCRGGAGQRRESRYRRRAVGSATRRAHRRSAGIDPRRGYKQQRGW